MFQLLRHGPPRRVLIHGFTGAVSSWDRVCAYFKDDHGVLGMRLLGHHPDVPVSSVLHDPHHPAAFTATVDAMAAALAALHAGPLHLVGYSLGARLVLGLLVGHGHLVARATLLGVHPGLTDAVERATRQQADARWQRMLRADGMEAFIQHWQSLPLWRSQASLSEPVLHAQARVRAQHDPLALADALAATSLAVMPSYWQDLPNIYTPVCFAAGAQDDKFLALMQAAHHQTPASRCITVANSGHNLPLEAPKQVARLIMAMETR